MNAEENLTDIYDNWTDFVSIETGSSASVWKIFLAADALTITLGILPNLWLLIALLTSKDLRSRMRNKLICSMCFIHLLNSLVVIPIQLGLFELFLTGLDISCHALSAVHHVELMQDFISNWTIVMMVAAFLTKSCDYKGCGGFKFKTVDIGAYAVLVSPWLASLVTVPAITHSMHFSHLQIDNVSVIVECVFATGDAYRAIKCLDTFVPLVGAVALLMGAVVTRRPRFARGLTSGLQVHLIDGGPEVDNLSGYAAAVVLAFTIDMLDVIWNSFPSGRSLAEIHILAASYFVTQSKVYLSFLPWLLFPDIRERIKTWRPWRCVSPGTDTTIMLAKVKS